MTVLGTPDYIAPEIFLKKGYDEKIDYWALGIIMYEGLFGYAPFFSNDMSMTARKIIKHDVHLSMPVTLVKNLNISDSCLNCLKHLICDKEVRYTFKDLKEHEFFGDVDWENLLDMKPPWIPNIDFENEDELSGNFKDRNEFQLHDIDFDTDENEDATSCKKSDFEYSTNVFCDSI